MVIIFTLLVLWLIVALIGFSIKTVLWLGIVAVAGFAVTLVFGVAKYFTE